MLMHRFVPPFSEQNVITPELSRSDDEGGNQALKLLVKMHFLHIRRSSIKMAQTKDAMISSSILKLIIFSPTHKKPNLRQKNVFSPLVIHLSLFSTHIITLYQFHQHFMSTFLHKSVLSNFSVLAVCVCLQIFFGKNVGEIITFTIFWEGSDYFQGKQFCVLNISMQKTHIWQCKYVTGQNRRIEQIKDSKKAALKKQSG